MPTPIRLMIFVALFAMAACDQTYESDPGETEMVADTGMSAEMDKQAGGETGRTANAEGTVTAIDDEAGTITIDHDPVPDVDWPAMTMAFAATENQRASVSEGDMVTFNFKQTDAGGEIVSLTNK